MTPHQLRTLCAVAETGSLAAASRRLFVSPAAVSSTLAQLAKEVGVALTARSGRGIELTDAGRELATRAARILGEIDDALLQARRIGTPQRALLRLGAVATVGEELLPRWLLAYLSQGADPEVHVAVGNKGGLFTALTEHRVDLVISGRPSPSDPLVVVATRDHTLVALASPSLAGRAFADPGHPTPAELAACTWLLREPGSGTRSSAGEVLGALGISPPLMTIGSNLAIRRLAELGIGLTILSNEAVREPLEAGTLVSLSVAGLPEPRTWCLVTRAPGDLTPGARSLVTFLARTGEITLTPAIANSGEAAHRSFR